MQRKMLMLSASPRGQIYLRIAEECRDLEEKLQLVKYRTCEIIVKHNGAVRTDQIQDAIWNERPEILHFSGHGGDGKLLFENVLGHGAEVPGTALADLIKLNKKFIKCVVLNCCYSDEIGALIAPNVECVVGCAGEVADNAAIPFSRAFYRALANGETFHKAFEFATNEIRLAGMEAEAAKYVCLP